MATTSNAASVCVPATASIVPYLFLRGAIVLPAREAEQKSV
jgi:hypothetical protein